MIIVIFIASIVGIIGLFVFRGWEISRNKKIASSGRAKLDESVLKHVEDIKTHGPRTARHVAHVSAYHTKLMANKTRMGLVTFIEAKLLGVVDMLRGKKVVKREDPPSSFLKIVSEHKKSNSKDINSNS
jgi:hypothetical protein